MLIPSKYFLEEGKEQPEGTTLKTCRFCNGRFAIPNDEVDKYEKSTVCDSDSCVESSNKEGAAAAAALLKPKTDAEDTIKSALGN